MTTTFDFQDGNGPVPAHQHPNGGGWVADTATVATTAVVGLEARVFGNACVAENARVVYRAQVSGNAYVYGNARVFDCARVYGDAWVYGDARVYGSAEVFGKAEVADNARVNGNAVVCEEVRLGGKAHLSGNPARFDSSPNPSPSMVYALISVHYYALQGIFATRLGAEEAQGKLDFLTIIAEWEVKA